MQAAIYRADGVIVQIMQGAPRAIDATAKAMGLTALELPADIDTSRLDVTHRVTAGALTAIGDVT